MTNYKSSLMGRYWTARPCWHQRPWQDSGLDCVWNFHWKGSSKRLESGCEIPRRPNRVNIQLVWYSNIRLQQLHELCNYFNLVLVASNLVPGKMPHVCSQLQLECYRCNTSCHRKVNSPWQERQICQLTTEVPRASRAFWEGSLKQSMTRWPGTTEIQY